MQRTRHGFGQRDVNILYQNYPLHPRKIVVVPTLDKMP